MGAARARQADPVTPAWWAVIGLLLAVTLAGIVVEVRWSRDDDR
jgi:hypothetical protein